MSDDIKERLDTLARLGGGAAVLIDAKSRIEALEAQLADTEGGLAANRALVDLRDKRLAVAEAQLAAAREETIEQCAKVARGDYQDRTFYEHGRHAAANAILALKSAPHQRQGE